MTYLFKSPERGDVLMRQPDAEALLRIIGRTPGPQGVIDRTALPAAIAAIERAISQDDARDTSPEEVSLRQRAWPLLQMLAAAQAAASRVTWGV